MDFKGKLILAPMAGYTDIPFRTLCKRFGADITVSEMISAKGLYYGDKKTAELMAFEEFERPFGIQIFGKEADILAYASREISAKYKPDFIDINMGCPAPKIAGSGEGSALLKNPDLIYNIAAESVKGSAVPVTAKIRIGWDETSINAVQIAKALESAGVSAITVHGRTRSQMFRPPVNLHVIKEVKDSVNIPVIANGDIVDYSSAEAVFSYTGADSVMIGRGAVGNPFVFAEIKAGLNNRSFTAVDLEQRKQIIIEHIDLMLKYKGQHGLVELRKHIPSYLKGLKGAKKINIAINKETDFNIIKEIILSI